MHQYNEAVIELPSPANPSSTQDLAWGFKALSDPARLKILIHLASSISDACGSGESVCACDLEQVTGLSQPTVSHHMKCLMSAGLVSGYKKGKWMHYSLSKGGIAQLQSFLQTLVA